MDDPKLASRQLEEEAERSFAFTGLKTPVPNDRFVLIMGMTGAGKSTFVARCSGKEVQIGHTLTSSTGSISTFDYTDDRGRHVHLIDTPGFDDTNRPDAETLKLLGTYLSSSYAGGVHIDGVIYLQRITDVRMGSSNVHDIAMLKAMCDLPQYSRFAIVTTMWPSGLAHGRDRDLLSARENDLRTNERYFGPFVSGGARFVRHAVDGIDSVVDDSLSARQIVSQLLADGESQEPMVLRVQRELVDEQKTLQETLAGEVVHCDIHTAQEEHGLQLSEIYAQMTAYQQNGGNDLALLLQLEHDFATRIGSIETRHRREQMAIKWRLEQKLEESDRLIKDEIREFEDRQRAARRYALALSAGKS